MAATPALLAAERSDPRELASALDAGLPADWPPKHHDASAIRYTAEALSSPESAGWWLHYFVTDNDDPGLAGAGGFKGPPADGMVEVGYSVVPSAQRRGYATAAVSALIDSARARGATRVRAETLPELAPSIGVLQKLGFTSAPPPAEPGVIAFELEI